MNNIGNAAMIAVKKELRKSIQKKIKEMPEATRQADSDTVINRLIQHPVYEQSKRVSIYIAKNDELPTKKIIENIFQSGKECFVPRYNKSEMAMVKLKSMEDLEQLSVNEDNIQQPLESDEREDAMKTGGLDLVLVPGRAFTKDGKRIGRGKGYYDKYLTELFKVSPNCVVMGLAFGCQIVQDDEEDLPMSTQDVPLDYVIHPLSQAGIK